MRSLAGERRDALVGAFRLRCGSKRLSSVDEGYGELLFARDEAMEEEVAFGESLRIGDDRADDDSPGRAIDLSFGFGAGALSTATFSMRILGGATLNL